MFKCEDIKICALLSIFLLSMLNNWHNLLLHYRWWHFSSFMHIFKSVHISHLFLNSHPLNWFPVQLWHDSSFEVFIQLNDTILAGRIIEVTDKFQVFAFSTSPFPVQFLTSWMTKTSTWTASIASFIYSAKGKMVLSAASLPLSR